MALLVRSSEQRPGMSRQGFERFSFTFLAATDQHAASDHAGIGASQTIPDESTTNPNQTSPRNRTRFGIDPQASGRFAFRIFVLSSASGGVLRSDQ